MITTTRCGSERLWSSLITGANLAARSIWRDREMSAARALTPGLDFMVAMELHERVQEIGESFLGERSIDVINSTDLRAVGVDVRERSDYSQRRRGSMTPMLLSTGRSVMTMKPEY